MKADRLGKVMLALVIILLLLNLVYGLWIPSSVMAEKENSDKGRYQISAWSSQYGVGHLHNGYYIMDTATGKVIEAVTEFHTYDEEAIQQKHYHKIERHGQLQ